MPRFFFHIGGGGISAIDPDGTDFPDLETARREAVLSVKSIVGDELRAGGKLNLDRRIDVTDESGDVVLILPFGDAISE